MTDRLRLSEGNRRWWTLGAMSFALFMIMLDNTAVNVALPTIQKSFDASLSSLEWTVNAYTLSFAVLLVTGGRLGDIFGRRRMFLFGVVVFGLSSAFIGLSQSEAWLVGGRALALAIGPVVGGFLVENVSWQSIFFLNVPVAALAVFVTLAATRESRDESSTHHIDIPGVAFLSIGLASLVLALVEG